MEITPEVRNEIIRGLMRLRSPFKVANSLGYDIRIVLPIADELAENRTIREEVYGGYGRPELRDFLVARKRATEVWDNELPEIADARAAYEAGTHEMTTGRDGDWLLLYSIPRKKVQPRPGHFLPEF